MKKRTGFIIERLFSIQLRMRKKYPEQRNKVLLFSAVLLWACFVFSCANIGNPNGGPYDETPPSFVGSRPPMNQLNFTGSRVEIFFDEYITIENPSENVIITPPQKIAPVIQALGKKIRVDFKDSMILDVTYTIDFTSSIVDNNEKNALENFSFAFSTGDVLDTLQISGKVINAEDLEVVQKMMVGIHSDLSDTVFTTTEFLRTSKTDDRGRFSIKNIAPGSYRVFALEDKNRNYAYDKNNDEGLAFLDSILMPSSELVIVSDTIWKDSTTVDTIMMVERTQFIPKDLVLWYFKDSVPPRQRMLRPERTKEHIFTLKFNAPLDTFPKPVPLNFEPADSEWYVSQIGQDPENFAINYWIIDSMIYKIDTLQMEVAYWKANDSIPDLLELQTDTLNVMYREPRVTKKETRSKRPVPVRRTGETHPDSIQPEVEPVIPLQMSISPNGSINPYDVLSIQFNEPVLDVRKDFFVMELGVDTLWEAVDFEFEIDTTHEMTYLITYPFKYEENYRISVDSARFVSIYGRENNPTTAQMTVKSDKEYGQFEITVKGIPLVESDSGQMVPVPAYLELLNSNGIPVKKAYVENGRVTFRDLAPDKYFTRIILDSNGNGRWDAGNYEERRQPELVYYWMHQENVRQNWFESKEWDLSNSVLGEKPEELIINKPKEEQRVRRDYREESKPRSSGNSTPNFGGIRF